jgi:DNA repair exonuclease SbcCD nuclease subunit
MSFKKMVKTLVIGDLHLYNKPYGLLDSQCSCIKKIIEKEQPGEVIFLGDVFMRRRPIPSVLLAFKDLLQTIKKSCKKIHILRGNHDSENKSDDGVTALSLFSETKISIYNHTFYDKKRKYLFIPHYEDETIIQQELKKAPPGCIVFGHFGYFGSLNSAGDADFSISLAQFRNSGFLGHIHRFNQGTVEVKGSLETVTLLGTPYSTNFSEAGKDNYYAVLDDGGPRNKKNTGWISSDGETYRTEFKPIEHGPRYLVMDPEGVEDNLDFVNSKDYFTLLRININTLNEDDSRVNSIISKLDVGHVEVKYKPVIDEKLALSDYDPAASITDINEELIEKYINNSNTSISKEALLSGLRLINEDQQDRN